MMSAFTRGTAMEKGSAIRKKKRGGVPVFYFLMLALPVLQFVVFYIVVNVNSLLLAFKYTGGGELNVWADPLFSNFETFFYFLTHESVIIKAIGKSLIFCALSIFFVMPLSLLFSYYIYKKFLGKKLFKVILVLPGMISSMILVIIFRYFNDRALPVLLDMFGIEYTYTISQSGDPVANFLLMVIFFLLFAYSSSVLLYMNAMSGIDTSVIEAAKMDGAPELRTFFSVIIPGIWSTVVSFVAINIAAIATSQANMFSFYQSFADTEVQTFGYYLYTIILKEGSGSFTDPIGFGKAATSGIVATLVIAPVTILVRFLLTKYGPSTD